MDEKIAELSFEARLCFIGLWCMADRKGILEDNPLKIKASIFSGDLSVSNKKVNIVKILKELTLKPFIVRYVSDNRNYIKVISFEKNQSIHNTEKESVLPDFNGYLTVNSPLDNGAKGESPVMYSNVKLGGNQK